MQRFSQSLLLFFEDIQCILVEFAIVVAQSHLEIAADLLLIEVHVVFVLDGVFGVVVGRVLWIFRVGIDGVFGTVTVVVVDGQWLVALLLLSRQNEGEFRKFALLEQPFDALEDFNVGEGA